MDAESASSVLMSRTLDELGYSDQMVGLRQDLYEKLGLSSVNGSTIAVGSKGEGLSRFSESDTDLLYVSNHILGTSNHHMLYNNDESPTVFYLDRANTAPGYTRLICVKTGTHKYPLLQTALTEPIAGNIYLSSDSWREEMRKSISEDFLGHLRQEPSQGPSNPILDPVHGEYSDLVGAIICYCPDILQSWLHRPRRYDWPSAEVIEDISALEAHVVPVGFKGSPLQFLEWRICFTKAELRLIRSLNDTQTKLMILLKMIAKSSLKPVCKEMTTYVMKNIVLWLAEIFPPDCFTEQNLFLSVKAALRFLKKCLIARCLPSYMIPERNLLTHSLAERNRSGHSARIRLCAKIDILLHEGPRMLLRCEKIRNAWNMLYTAPETFYHFANTCRKAEIITQLMLLCLSNGDLDLQFLSSGDLDLQAKEKLTLGLLWAYIETVLPDLQELLLLRQNDVTEVIQKRQKLFLT